MAGGGGGQSTNTITKSDPWAGLQPYLTGSVAEPARPWTPGNPAQPARGAIQGVLPAAQQWFESGSPTPYQGNTVAQLDPNQLQALQRTSERSLAGSDLNRAAQSGVQSTLQGDYLNANPYLDATFDKAAGGLTRQYQNTVMPSIVSMYSTAGRYGSGAMQGATAEAGRGLGEGLSGLANDIYGGNYQAERGRMMSAATMAPQLASQDYADIQAQLGAGGVMQAQNQQNLNADISKWDFMQNQPLNKLQAMSGLINGTGAGLGQQNSQTTAGQSGFNLGGAIGGGMTGYAAGGALASALAPAAATGGGAAAGAAAGSPYGWWGAAAGALLGSGIFN